MRSDELVVHELRVGAYFEARKPPTALHALREFL